MVPAFRPRSFSKNCMRSSFSRRSRCQRSMSTVSATAGLDRGEHFDEGTPGKAAENQGYLVARGDAEGRGFIVVGRAEGDVAIVAHPLNAVEIIKSGFE